MRIGEPPPQASIAVLGGVSLLRRSSLSQLRSKFPLKFPRRSGVWLCSRAIDIRRLKGLVATTRPAPMLGETIPTVAWTRAF